MLDKDVRGRLRRAQQGPIVDQSENLDETMDKAISAIIGVLLGCILFVIGAVIVEASKELMKLFK